MQLLGHSPLEYNVAIVHTNAMYEIFLAPDSQVEDNPICTADILVSKDINRTNQTNETYKQEMKNGKKPSSDDRRDSWIQTSTIISLD